MTDDNRLSDYLQLQYEVRMVFKDGTYHLAIPELGLHQSDADMQKAHEKLMAAKEEWLRELCAQKLYSWIVAPGGGGGGGGGGGTTRLELPSVRQQLTPFAIKTSVVVVILLTIGMFVGNAVTSAGRGMERDLHRIPSWSEEKVEKYRLHTREIVQKLKPIFDEITPLLQTQPAREKAVDKGPDK